MSATCRIACAVLVLAMMSAQVGAARPEGINSTCVLNGTFPFRLPLTVYPLHYSLQIQPSIPGYESFAGSANITVEVFQPTSCIVLNTANMAVPHASIQVNNHNISAVVTILAYYQQLVLEFGTMLPMNQPLVYTVSDAPICYRSSRSSVACDFSSIRGFFKSAGDYPTEQLSLSTEELSTAAKSWRSHKSRRAYTPRPEFNTSLVMLATQFESSSARYAFPAFDEPSFKATFQASFIVPSNRSLTVLFNTPQVSSMVSGELETVSFATTPQRMSCYLVAYCIGQFDYVERVSNNITFRVYTPPGKSAYGEYSLNVTIATIDYFGQLWDFKFPFPKVDSIAVPAIIQDAMENWGLLTYDPTFLLVTPHTPFNQRQLVTEVVTHELSHQWFGDLITMPWFSQMYLNEGFARYLQYVMTNELFPQWNVWSNGPDFISFLQFAYSMIEEDSLGLLPGCVVPDYMYDGNPYYSKYLSPDWMALFYGKGAAVNRMFAMWLGEDWIKGLQTQIATYQYTNPTYTDLMLSLTSANTQAGASMLPWLTQSGLPLVTISYNSKTSLLDVTQSPVDSTGTSYTWFVPLEIQIDSQLFTIYLNASNSSFDVGLKQAPNFIYGNPNYTSYVVVTYPSNNWAHLLTPAFVGSLNSSMQLQFAQSLFILARNSHMPLTDSLLAFASVLSATKSASNVTWPYVISHLLSILQSMTLTDNFNGSAIQQSVASSLTPLALQLGFQKKSPVPGWSDQMRRQVLLTAVQFGSIQVTDLAIDAYSKYDGNINASAEFTWPAILLAQVLGNNASLVEPTLLSQLFSSTAGHESSALEQALLSSLVFTHSAAVCSDLIAYASRKGVAQVQLLLNVLTALLQNPVCKKTAWDGFVSIAPGLLQELGSVSIGQQIINVFAILRLCIAMLIRADTYTSKKDYSDALEFLDTNSPSFPQWQLGNAVWMMQFNQQFVTMNAQ